MVVWPYGACACTRARFYDDAMNAGWRVGWTQLLLLHSTQLPELLLHLDVLLSLCLALVDGNMARHENSEHLAAATVQASAYVVQITLIPCALPDFDRAVANVLACNNSKHEVSDQA